MAGRKQMDTFPMFMVLGITAAGFFIYRATKKPKGGASATAPSVPSAPSAGMEQQALQIAAAQAAQVQALMKAQQVATQEAAQRSTPEQYVQQAEQEAGV